MPFIPDQPPLASSTDTSAKPLHFYFHSTSEPVLIAGSGTHYVMDTTRTFSKPSPFYKPIGQPKIAINFYLYPELAGPVTLDGEWQVLIWVNGTALKPTGWGVRFFERDPEGNNVWDSTELKPKVVGGPTGFPGYVDVPVNGYTLSTPLEHTFARGNTIEVQVTVNPGSAVAIWIWYDSPSYPSQAILPSLDYARPVAIGTYDANSTEQRVFSVFWDDDQRKVIARVNVTDPFGGYDVYMVNISISDPFDRVVLPNRPMERVLGSSFSYLSTYEASWPYPSTAALGNYTINVSVVDLNGWYQYTLRRTFVPYIEYATMTFSMGLQYPVRIRVLDNHDNPLADADLSASSAGLIAATGRTDLEGWWDVALYTGPYTISVFWQGTKVAEAPIEIISAGEFTIRSAVYYPTFSMLDNTGEPLEGAWVYVTFPNGTITPFPFVTDANGLFSLVQSPAGDYALRVLWRGVTVGESTFDVNSDGPYTLRNRVYRATLKAIDDEERPVQGAYVAISSSIGTIFEFDVTDASGEMLARLPSGEYIFRAFWEGVLVHESTNIVDHDGLYSIPSQIYTLTVNVTDNEGKPLKGVYVVASTPRKVFGFGVTRELGLTTLTLPKGTYQVSTYYNTTYWLNSISNYTQVTVPVTSKTLVQVSISNYPPALWTTMGFWLIVIPVLLLTAGMVLTLKRRRRT